MSESPWEWADGEIPGAYGDGYDMETKEHGDVLDPFPSKDDPDFEGFFVKNEKKLYEILGAQPLDVPEDQREYDDWFYEDYADPNKDREDVLREYLEYDRFAELVGDNSGYRNSSWERYHDFLETVQAIWELRGVHTFFTRSNGFCQGDSVWLLLVATPAFLKAHQLEERFADEKIRKGEFNSLYERFERWAWSGCEWGGQCEDYTKYDLDKYDDEEPDICHVCLESAREYAKA